MEKVLIPVLLCAFQMLGMAVCAYLFVSLKRDLHRLETRRQKQEQEIEIMAARTRRALEELQAALQEAESKQAGQAAWTPPASGINMNKRAQALRMYRRGERPEQIAAALGIPLAEVELLLKVHQMLVHRS